MQTTTAPAEAPDHTSGSPPACGSNDRPSRQGDGLDRGPSSRNDNRGGLSVRGAPDPSIGENCPPLGDLLETLRELDRLQCRAVELVGYMHESGEVEQSTGLDVETWLAAEGRCTRSDRRMLGTAADTLRLLPGVRDAFRRGILSWSQVRAIALKCERLPGHLCRHIDDALGPEVDALSDAEPDAILHVVNQTIASLDPDNGRERHPGSGKPFVHLQPHLDGEGGRLYAELDGLGLAIVERATDPGPPPAGSDADETDDESGRRQPRTQARRRAVKLVDVLAASLAAGSRTDNPSSPAGARSGTRTQVSGTAGATNRAESATNPATTTSGVLPVAPTLLLTMSLDTLLGHDDTPAHVLSSITGGHLRVASATARTLIDQGGAAVRAIVLDDTGEVLGVGRRMRLARGWLRDAMLARDRVCAEPCCERAAVTCDADHIVSWREGGGTDLSSIQPLCASANRTRRHEWIVRRLDDGTRRWTHRRSGLTTRTVPSGRRARVPTCGGCDPP